MSCFWRIRITGREAKKGTYNLGDFELGFLKIRIRQMQITMVSIKKISETIAFQFSILKLKKPAINPLSGKITPNIFP